MYAHLITNLLLNILLQALDYLAIAVHELAQMSERRLERLVNHVRKRSFSRRTSNMRVVD